MASSPRRGAPPTELRFLQPMECLQVSKLPEGADWTYEVKLDDYRAQALCYGERTRFLSRNGNNLGLRFPGLLQELAAAIPEGSILDGELVALDQSGQPSFSLIQNSASSGARFVFFAFDLLLLAWADLTDRPLAERRERLSQALQQSEGVQLSASLRVPAAQMLEMVREQGLEGVIAKRLSSTYEQGQRSGAWVKVRLELAQELVIAGCTPGAHGFDAVLVGFYRGDQLYFCGSVRNGFTAASRRALHARLAPFKAQACPFVNLPETGPKRWGQGLTAARMKHCLWLRPETVAQFRFQEWTPGDRLRHASFVAVREDKEPRSVVKEGEAAPVARIAPQGVSAGRKQRPA